MSFFEAATNPPTPPKDLLNVPVIISTCSKQLKCSTVPFPFSPMTPIPCASSTINIASYVLHKAMISGSIERSPSCEYTPSIITNFV